MNTDPRPDPDALLRAAQSRRRGRLKIFLGAAPGVGKTYAMLGAAAERVAAGDDVVIGVVETHGRAETAKLVEGLPAWPLRTLQHGSRLLEELDLDGLLKRRPQLALIDEFAHSNAPGSRHLKRYEDVEELLAAGIDVYTTVNIQHLESLNDAVASITGVRVRETVPDRWLQDADAIELVDLPPETLLERLKAGKVYVPEQAERAMERFFNVGNLTALRDLAMRAATARIDADVDAYLRRHPSAQPWPTHSRLLVSVGGDSVSKAVVRAAARIAHSRRQAWIAVHVINSRANTLSNARKDVIAEALRLAEQLGGEAVTIPGEDVAAELLRYARTRNVTQIVVGRAQRSLWRMAFVSSVSFQLMRAADGFDVTFVDTSEPTRVSTTDAPSNAVQPFTRRALAEIAASTGATTLLALLFDRFVPVSNLSMLYLLAVLAVAVRHGRYPAFATAALSFLAYNFLFTDPRYSLMISLRDEWVTLLFFLVVAVAAGQFAAQLRGQMQALRKTASRTANLNEFSRRLARARTQEQVGEAIVQHVHATLGTASVLTIEAPDARLRLLARAGIGGEHQYSETDRTAAAWCWQHLKPAGAHTSTLPGSDWLFMPLGTAGGIAGVVGLDLQARGRPLSPGQRRLLEAITDQAAVALERTRLSLEVQIGRIAQESEQLRSALLASVSHDLRTPLASIIGSASTLVELRDRLPTDQRDELGQTILQEAQRLDRHVQNLLDMTRLSRGAVVLKREPSDIGEVVTAAADAVRKVFPQMQISWAGASPLDALWIDAVLMRALFVNLFENAARHGRADVRVVVAARRHGGEWRISVSDDGPGVPPAQREAVFEMFARSQQGDLHSPGTGLGLAICRSIAQLHQGSIALVPPLGGPGACVEIRLPEVARNASAAA